MSVIIKKRVLRKEKLKNLGKLKVISSIKFLYEVTTIIFVYLLKFKTNIINKKNKQTQWKVKLLNMHIADL